MRRVASLAAIAATLGGASVSAEELGETAARFGARESVSAVSISPSGNKLLYVSPGQASAETIYVVDLAANSEPRAITTMNEAMARLSWCQWATEEQIVCDLYGYQKAGSSIVAFNRLLSISSDGKDVTRLSPDTDYRTYGVLQDGGTIVALDVPGADEGILLTRRYIKESSKNTRLFNDREGLGVDVVDVTSGRGRVVEQPNRNTEEYIADETGRVRLMGVREADATGYAGSKVRYYYRSVDSDAWKPLSQVEFTATQSTGFLPVAVDSEKDVVFGFEAINGYQALVTMALDGSGRREVLVARDDVDVDGLIRIGRQRRVVGASYATEKRTVEYFDSDLDALAGNLAKAIPGRPLISIVDASEDENEIILVASSDTDPGMIYLYERDSRQLSELLPLRDPLVGREMGAMRPVTFPASDGTQIPGFLTLPPGSDGRNLPTVVLPHGGPGARDEWGFDWLVQFLAARGYAVMQPNFRGSAGYGEAWFGRNGFQAWETALSDVNDAGRWLVEQGIADPSRLAIAGWSYGGYAALQSQVLDSSLYKAVVAIAPVTDLDLLREENRRYSSYRLVKEFVGDGPHVGAGSPARHAESFSAPVLLFHGTMDLNVSSAHSELMERRLKAAGKAVEYTEFEGLDHGLVHTQARAIMLRKIGDFLDASLGG